MRPEAKAKMGYYPVEAHHHAAIVSLVAPGTSAHRLLDPYAGEGEFLDYAAKAWTVTPYANELDGERAAKCLDRFGPQQAVRCDVERLSASLGAFSIGWLNPPYDYDADSKNSKRIEFVYLRHAWKWLQDGAVAMWCVYRSHLTEEAAAFFAKNSTCVDVWALPGKHQGEYEQIVVVALKTAHQPNPGPVYQQILAQKADPLPLVVQPEPLYALPKPPTIKHFVFAPDLIDEEQGLRLLQAQGAWQTQGFQALLDVPPPPTDIVPPVAPRPGHTALVLAAGIADGAVIAHEQYGRVALRGKTVPVEQIARVEIETDPNDPERQIKKTTMRLKPTTTLTLLAQDGTVVEMNGDEPLLDFIRQHRQALAQYLNTRFRPLYQFDLNGLGPMLSRIRLKGQHPLYLAQQHVIAALTRAFEDRDRLLLIGSMGSGKTAMGGTTAMALATGSVKALRGQMKGDQVVLIVAPPHLLEKWKRELVSLHPNVYVERLDRHEQVKAFMTKAAQIGGVVPKIGLIKRDLTKLGSARESSVIWRTVGRALWRHNDPTPAGYEAHQRIVRERLPTCPHCGEIVMQTSKGGSQPATETWLHSGKRACETCGSPLWQEARDSGAKPKPGEKYPSKNPRMRLDEYIKRQYKERVYLLIWDEAHECQSGDTGNGVAFGRLAGVAKKVLAMTGTPFNGRSSSLFNLEYHLNARVREQYNWGGSPRLSRKAAGQRGYQGVIEDTSKQRGRAESRWVSTMGVLEQVIEERPTYDRESGVYTGTTTYERPYEESPGISPRLVAELLDHSVFFGLGDLAKSLPEFQEIALPVTPDADVADLYDSTRQYLKDYLTQRRWEGDVSFRGAYLQWSLGWINTPDKPYPIIHNLKDRLTGQTRPYTVRHLESLGQERIYAKEQALIDLVRDELAADRPCVIYVRQTQTRDLQPRLMALIQRYIPAAKPYILKNTVAAERREAVIDQQVQAGINILITNPELTKTGLDLLFAPTLIFFEPTLSLSTMMQAAARSYRLNQTHALCRVVYLFYQNTMEHHMIQLMSRKQRAAKLLNGEIGLSGLDALTEGEGGLEESLMQAIGQETSLLDPTQLFKTDHVTSAIDEEDAAFWNVAAESVSPLVLLPASQTDPLVLVGQELGATISKFAEGITPIKEVDEPVRSSVVMALASSTLLTVLTEKFSPVSRLAPERQARVQARLAQVLEQGVPHPTDGSLKLCEGVLHPDFARYPVHAESLTRWIAKYLRAEKALDPDHIPTFAAELVALASQSDRPKVVPSLPKGQTSARTKRSKLDLMAIPTIADPNTVPIVKPSIPSLSSRRTAPTTSRQPLLFNLPHVPA